MPDHRISHLIAKEQYFEFLSISDISKVKYLGKGVPEDDEQVSTIQNML